VKPVFESNLRYGLFLFKPKIKMAEEVKQEEVQEEVVAQEDAPSKEPDLDDFMDQVLEKGKYEKGQEVEEEEVDNEEVEEETEEVKEISEERVNELIQKSESKNLTEEEIAELKEAGYEVEMEEDTQGKAEEETKEEESEEEKEEPWTAPDYVANLKEFYPDGSFDTPEAVDEGVKSLISDLKARQEEDQMLYEAVQKNPQLEAFLEATVTKGMSLSQALVEAGIDPNEVVPKPGEDGYKEYMTQQIEREQTMRKQSEFTKKKQANLQNSAREAKAFFAENKMDEGDIHKLSDKMDKILADFNEGRITKDLLKLVYDGLNVDKKVKSEVQKAVVKEKNAKINKIRIKKKGDGVARPTSKNQSQIKSQKVEFADDGSQYLAENGYLDGIVDLKK
jgi:hypothetical protein